MTDETYTKKILALCRVWVFFAKYSPRSVKNKFVEIQPIVDAKNLTTSEETTAEKFWSVWYWRFISFYFFLYYFESNAMSKKKSG